MDHAEAPGRSGGSVAAAEGPGVNGERNGRRPWPAAALSVLLSVLLATAAAAAAGAFSALLYPVLTGTRWYTVYCSTVLLELMLTASGLSSLQQWWKMYSDHLLQ